MSVANDNNGDPNAVPNNNNNNDNNDNNNSNVNGNGNANNNANNNNAANNNQTKQVVKRPVRRPGKQLPDRPQRALCCLSLKNPLRKLCINVIEWKYPFYSSCFVRFDGFFSVFFFYRRPKGPVRNVRSSEMVRRRQRKRISRRPLRKRRIRRNTANVEI